MKSLTEQIIEKCIPKSFGEDFIGHECQCGNPIICKHREQARTEMINKIPELINLVKEDTIER